MKPILLLVAAIAMPAAELRIDHVTVAGRSLSVLTERLQSVGIKVEPGGPHGNRATEMAIASFPDGSYLELIALQPNYNADMLAQHPWARYIEGNAGPAAWAVRPKDFGAEVSRLQSAGMVVKTAEGGRKRSDGVSLEWQTATLGADPSGVVLPFLIRDQTSREKRAFPSGKAANREHAGVLRVVIAVRKIADAVDRFQRAYPGIGKPLRQVDAEFGAELAWFADTPVILAAPLGTQQRVARRLDQFGEGPCAFILGSKKELKHDTKMRSRWFGRDIQWFDPEQLGWLLGVAEQ